MFRQSPLFQFRHGDHICVFYRSEDSLREVLTPYIAEGLRRGQKCFCAQKPYIGGQLFDKFKNYQAAFNTGAILSAIALAFALLAKRPSAVIMEQKLVPETAPTSAASS